MSLIFTLVPFSIQALYENATIGLTGPVDYVHTCVDFGNVSLTVNGTKVYLPTITVLVFTVH